MEIHPSQRLLLLQEKIGQVFDNSPSPYMRWLQATVIEATRGRTVVEIFVRKEMTNPLGMLHGGVIASIHDELTGLTNACLGNEGAFVTTDLHTRFYKPAFLGETVRVEGLIAKEGKSIVFADSHLYNANGDLLSSGSATLYRPAKRPQ